MERNILAIAAFVVFLAALWVEPGVAVASATTGYVLRDWLALHPVEPNP